jgi:hypothetical protein
MVFLSSENHPDIGAIAQLGEHLLCKQGVRGSIPRSSTMLDKSITKIVFLPNVSLRSNFKAYVNVFMTCSFTNWKAKVIQT